LSLVIDASYTTPTIHINKGSILMKLIEGDIVYVLGGSRTYPGSQPQFPSDESGRTSRYSVTVTHCEKMKQ